MNHVIAGVETEGSLHVVTGSKDRSLRLYKVKKLLFYLLTQNLTLSIIIYFLYVSLWLGLLKCDPSVSVDYPKRVGAYKILRGHTSSVQSIAVDPSSDLVINHSIWSFTSMFIAIFTYCDHVSFWPLISVPSSVLVPGIAPSSCGQLKDPKKTVMLFHWRREGWILTHLNLKSLS